MKLSSKKKKWKLHQILEQFEWALLILSQNYLNKTLIYLAKWPIKSGEHQI